MNERWPPPADSSAFESLCADLWGTIWGQAALKNGRNGQPQAGVDIYGRHGGKWIGVQCKQKDERLGTKLTAAELTREVKAARSFVPPLSRFIVATTGPADAAIQELARSLTEEHSRQGLFEIEVWSWTEIWAELNRRPALLQSVGPLYWPQLISVASERNNQERTDQILRAIQSPLLPCSIFLTLRIETTDEDLIRVYGDQAGFQKLPSPPTLVDGRHFLGDCYLDMQNGALDAAGFFRSKHPGYNVFHRNVRHTISRFNPARCRAALSENEPVFLPPQATVELYPEGMPRSEDMRPALVLKGTPTSAVPISSCALDNTVLVDFEYPPLTESPPDASGFSVTSLRGSFIRVVLDFFYIRSIACLPEQSWPRLHNFQLLLGSRRQALTFSLDDLSKSITRNNPNPIARGDAVMPQIVFECEIERDGFETKLVAVVDDHPHESLLRRQRALMREHPSGPKGDSRWSAAKPAAENPVLRDSQIAAACKLCEQRSTISARPVVPEYLFPEHPEIPREHLLCSACAGKIAEWDGYGERVMLAFPEDLGNLKGKGLAFEADYRQLRLWLLSLLWRMSIAKGPAWLDVELADDAHKIRSILLRADPGGAGNYPGGCVLPSFDGRHLEFSFQPDCVGQPDGRLVRVAFRGVLFFFLVREDVKDEELDAFYVRPDQNWIVPVLDWESIDFLRHWVEALGKGPRAATKNT